jgi:hypothetical protein
VSLSYFDQICDVARNDLREYPFVQAVDALLAVGDVTADRLAPELHATAARHYLTEPGANALAALDAALRAVTALPLPPVEQT